MYPLIEIKTVPIEIQMKTKQASLEYTRGTAEMEITRSDSGVDIRNRRIKLQQRDSFDKSISNNVNRMRELFNQSSYSAISAYANRGTLTLSASFNPVDDAAIQQLGDFSNVSVSTVSPQIPVQQQQSVPTPPAVSTAPAVDAPSSGDTVPDMLIRYDMDKQIFDMQIGSGKLKFTPGDIEISVVQQPSITIKFIGGAIYVPPSSDPDYVPVDVKA